MEDTCFEIVINLLGGGRAKLKRGETAVVLMNSLLILQIRFLLKTYDIVQM